MTLWAYGIATVGFFAGMYLVLILKKWKIGAWIACLSLAVFAGASINIHNLVSVDDAFKYEVRQQVSVISNDVGKIKIQMVQSMVLTQQIVQTVNLVTQVQKEVADVRETISELYKRTRIEQVLSTDSNKVFFLEKKDGALEAIIRLQNSPIPESISALAYSSDGGQMPLLPLSIVSFRNILAIVWKTPAIENRKASYCITYVLDPKNTNLYDKVEIRDGKLVLDGQFCVNFD